MPLFRKTSTRKSRARRNDFFVKEWELAIALDLELQVFDQLIEPMLQAAHGIRMLKEERDFIYHDRHQQIRLFSQEGALAIAGYLDSLDAVDLPAEALRTVLALLERHEIRKIDAAIRRAVLENSTSLRQQNDLYWLSTTDVIKILKTTPQRLQKAFEAIGKSSQLINIGLESMEFDDVIYFSLLGLARLSLELKRSLKSPQRQRYCERVPIVAPPVVEYLVLQPAPTPKAIEAAKRFAKNRDHITCQITGAETNKYNRLKLAAHHLFDQATYPVLAAEPSNLITINEAIHEEFHQWLGGKDKSCTIDDFIQFFEVFYADEKSVLVVQLWQRRTVLLEQLKRCLPSTLRNSFFP